MRGVTKATARSFQSVITSADADGAGTVSATAASIIGRLAFMSCSPGLVDGFPIWRIAGASHLARAATMVRDVFGIGVDRFGTLMRTCAGVRCARFRTIRRGNPVRDLYLLPGSKSVLACQRPAGI